MLFSKTQHGWRLMRQSLKAFKSQKKLLILPLMGRSFIFLTILACLLLIWSIRTGMLDYNKFSVEEILWGYVIIFSAFFLANVLSFYFNTALTFCLIQYEQNQTPAIMQNLSLSLRRIWAIFCWLAMHFTFGLLAMLAPQKFKKNRMLSGLKWSSATLLVPALIVNEPNPLFKNIKRSSQLIKTHCGEKPKINYSQALIFIIARTLALVPAIIAYSTRDKFWIILGITVTAILIFIVMVLQNAVSVVLSQGLYEYLAHKKTVLHFKAEDLSTAISA